MSRRTMVMLLAGLGLWAAAAGARIRPGFDLDTAAWEADHVVAVRVGDAIEVQEAWVGGLSPGDVLDVPGLESLGQAAYEEAIKGVPRTYPYSREPGGGLFVDAQYGRGELQSPPVLKLVEGSRAVLFLRDDEPDDGQPPPYPWLLTGSGRRFTRAHPHREALPLSVAWESEGNMWALAQHMNPGPLAPHWVHTWSPTEGRGSPFSWDAFHARVERVRTKKRELEAVLAVQDPEERIRALRGYDAGCISPAMQAVQQAVSQYLGAEVIQPAAVAGGDAAVEKALLAYIDSGLFVPEVAAFAAMAGVGRPGVAALQALLERPECAAFKSRIIDSLNGADGQHLAREFRELLAQENAYWRDKAADLSEPGWLDGRQDDAQTKETRHVLAQHADNVTRLLWTMKARLEEEVVTGRRNAIVGWVEAATNGVPPDQRQALAERLRAALAVNPSDDSYAALCLDAIRECREVWAALPARTRNGDEVNDQGGMAWLCDGILADAAQRPVPEPLELSPAVVRVFASMADVPNDYVLVPVLFEGYGFSCHLDDPSKDALLRMVAEDQPDAAFAALLGSSVHTWRFEEGRRYQLDQPREPMDCVVSDALCRPIANATIVGMLKPDAAQSEARRSSDGPWRTDAEGRVTIAAYRGDFWGPPKLVVSHPDYGRSDLIRPHPGSAVAPTGLVRRDSDEALLALRGVVVYREGQPVEGASVRLYQTMTPERRGLRSGDATVYTDAAGRFCLYPPPDHFRVDQPLGPLPKITHGCVLLYEVAAPDRSYLRKGGEIASGKEARIVLEKGLYRVLEFEDENGPITDPKRLASLQFSAHDLEAEWKDGRAHVYVRPGKLAASLPRNTPDGLVRCAFAPVVVTEDGPTELVLQLQPPPVRGPRIVGTAVHAVTGKPLAGVLVANSGGNIVESLAMLTVEEWETIESMPVHPDAGHPGFTLLKGMTDCARTDESGSYCMELPPSHDVHYVTAFARDFLTVNRWPNARSRSGDCVVTLEPFRMFPAGSVSLQVPGLDPAMPQVASWRVDDPVLPDWALPLVKGSPKYEGGIGGMRFIAIGEACRGSVPAGVQVSFRVQAVTRAAVQKWEVDRCVKVAQGEHVDLGEVTLQAGDVLED